MKLASSRATALADEILLDHLRDWPELEVLELSTMPVDADAVRATLAPLNHLNELILVNAPLVRDDLFWRPNDASADIRRSLAPRPSLPRDSNLDDNDNGNDDDDAPLTVATTLSGPAVDPTGVPVPRRPAFPVLDRLALERMPRVTADGLAKGLLAHAATASRLTSLSLSHTGVSVAGLHAVLVVARPSSFYRWWRRRTRRCPRRNCVRSAPCLCAGYTLRCRRRTRGCCVVAR